MGQAMSDARIALVVEDDPAVRDLATAVLEETDLDVIACETAEAAISVLEQPDLQVALLFADVRLPGPMDGLALARTVGRRWPETRVIVTSGADASRSMEMPEQARFMRKPWRPLDVLVEAEKATLRQAA
ncbi:MAG: response regulator [Methylobacterium sp. CG08_land_8_20_14_0_20_71_15]|uniref:Hydrogenase transcriptional regulatory protein hupR1 n=2 Tax=Methylobacteriaceae TaxID=119045 RepID=A0ABQ4SSS5_9HYPH|nr:MAG: response regulator [Methylobacterium sp. CG09_land_8_20_14_0_10_71_15]PIU15671.1 MAG: response regulator [Methylobacterium sp. CG08_land_8_20_14_0_20_71_15]GBU17273.1 response regulator [Methylobacterium sp.]GJE06255.1 Hydrogenase transcriptional regulatory protein hupR1 [Methylobacterium jeotgali]